MINIQGNKLDLRVSTVPAVFGERIVLRILLPTNVCTSLAQLELPEKDHKKLQGLCRLPHGVVICSGPTGSGKTTLLYAMLMEVDRAKCNVMSVEDPVEYTLERVAQIQIRPAMGLTFARVLRSILRQDPDVIMIGEIREGESLNIAAQAALTGHLVLTTLHTNNAVDAIRRVVDMGLPPFVANASLAAVVGQRLVRKLCTECREAFEPRLSQLPPEGIAVIEATPDATFYRAKGCDACRGLGYRGRAALHEILVMDDGVREQVGHDMDMAALHAAACRGGMETMLQNGMEKAAQGLTTIEEVLRVTPPPPGR
jgi:type II secretory ATPase GspE/PulE/Tfp pilus assembly ATPase PilB-like protein